MACPLSRSRGILDLELERVFPALIVAGGCLVGCSLFSIEEVEEVFASEAVVVFFVTALVLVLIE